MILVIAIGALWQHSAGIYGYNQYIALQKQCTIGAAPLVVLAAGALFQLGCEMLSALFSS